ncbi:MAG: GNAT family N-acetyltransferase [Myxococcota bacterium]
MTASMNVRLRTATPADRPALDAVYRRASLHGEADRQALLAHPELFVLGDGVADGRTRVAVDDAGVILGFATLAPPDATAPDALELEDLFVDPPAMRRGIARRLIDDAIVAARALGMKRIDVTGNAQARAFYEAVGFVQDGVAETAFGPAPRFRLALSWFDAESILAKLDGLAANGLWPRFQEALGTFEYHAMRMLAVRERGGAGDWGLAFECVHGDFLDENGDFNAYAANISTYVYTPHDSFGHRHCRPLPLTLHGVRSPMSAHIEGVTIRGPGGELVCHDAMCDALDLRPGRLCQTPPDLTTPFMDGCEDPNFVILLRAWLAHFPGSLWGDLTAAFDGPVDVVVASDAFEHVVGPLGQGDAARLPSQSATYRSLADALVHRDGRRFVPGPSNLDWRLWATSVDSRVR